MCPGPVTCLTTSPNGLYVLAGIAESIYLWEVSVRVQSQGHGVWPVGHWVIYTTYSVVTNIWLCLRGVYADNSGFGTRI